MCACICVLLTSAAAAAGWWDGRVSWEFWVSQRRPTIRPRPLPLLLLFLALPLTLRLTRATTARPDADNLMRNEGRRGEGGVQCREGDRGRSEGDVRSDASATPNLARNQRHAWDCRVHATAQNSNPLTLAPVQSVTRTRLHVSARIAHSARSSPSAELAAAAAAGQRDGRSVHQSCCAARIPARRVKRRARPNLLPRVCVAGWRRCHLTAWRGRFAATAGATFCPSSSASPSSSGHTVQQTKLHTHTPH